jgi:hypothetical protein
MLAFICFVLLLFVLLACTYAMGYTAGEENEQCNCKESKEANTNCGI